MFIYLSKKIAIPNDTKLYCVNWNSEQGWIACGGENGLLKVLKLDSVSSDKRHQGIAASTNLSMNQTLDGHKGKCLVVSWNENYRKLTSSDENGMIIVWILHKGMWYEEMINNRNKSVVTGLKWTADGTKICIVYRDGCIIAGSVDGNRIWRKELKQTLTHVEWSPDSRYLLFGTDQGEVLIFESKHGNLLHKLPVYCVEDDSMIPLAGIDWYDGCEGYDDIEAPTLAVCFQNGKCQLMKSETDDHPILIDTGMQITCIKWNTFGTVLGIAGRKMIDGQKYINVVQFYNPSGEHLRSLKVPGNEITGISWDGSGLRLAMTVESHIYFANVRPDYKWAHFSKTLVYAFTKLDRIEKCVVFWNYDSSGEKHIKYIKNLQMIRGAGEHCVLITKSEHDFNQHILILCNSIGSPIDSRFIDVEPKFCAMTPTHIVIASTHSVYVWQYKSSEDSTIYKRGSEYIFNIDDSNIQPASEALKNTSSTDEICSLCASNTCFIVGRQSGTIQQYTFSNLMMTGKFFIECCPEIMALNCNSTKLGVIDINGIFTLLQLPTRVDMSDRVQQTTIQTSIEKLGLERKEVWDIKFSEDNPDLFAIMEKTRMYIFRGLNVEEPILSSAYICQFSNLEILAVLLDDIMEFPENPQKDCIITFETKSLRDTKEIIKTVSVMDAFQFVKDNPHDRLWRLLAEAALEKMDFDIAYKAFINYKDYQGVQFVKYLKTLDDRSIQLAEVAAYFEKFDESEKIYKLIDRKDLAIGLRKKLGDYLGVLNLIKDGDGNDALMTLAWNNIGDYWADRLMWDKAQRNYEKAKNYEKLVECYYKLEDYDSLEALIQIIPEANSDLLCNIGDKFASVGICDCAVMAFLKAGEVKSAIDACVDLNQWDKAVELAERHNFKETSELLSKYANHLLEKSKFAEAIELYHRAGQYTEAAKILAQMASQAGKVYMNPLKAKKLYVLSALDIEKFKRKVLDTKKNTQQALKGLRQHEAEIGFDKSLDLAWRGAEAYHFFMLAQRQLYDQNVQDAFNTSCRLMEYDDIIEKKDVYSLIALTSYYMNNYQMCSKAFSKLESLETLKEEEREIYKNLAIDIFVKHPPKSTSVRMSYQQCHNCEHKVFDWESSCSKCGTIFYPCIVTGRAIVNASFWTCNNCKHRANEHEIYKFKYCPLCHSPCHTNP